MEMERQGLGDGELEMERRGLGYGNRKRETGETGTERWGPGDGELEMGNWRWRQEWSLKNAPLKFKISGVHRIGYDLTDYQITTLSSSGRNMAPSVMSKAS